jgi:hypothetical protein
MIGLGLGLVLDICFWYIFFALKIELLQKLV